MKRFLFTVFVLTIVGAMQAQAQVQEKYTFKAGTSENGKAESTNAGKSFSGFTTKAPTKLKVDPIKERQEEIRTSLAKIKEGLPRKVSDSVTWLDAYEKNNSIHYNFQIKTDTSKVPEDKKKELRQKLEKVICTKVNKSLCGNENNMLLKSNIRMVTHYFDINNNEIAVCDFLRTDCM